MLELDNACKNGESLLFESGNVLVSAFVCASLLVYLSTLLVSYYENSDAD